MDAADLLDRPWRTGGHLGRTVYALMGDEPSDDDPFLGIFDSADVASVVVADHNAARWERQGAWLPDGMGEGTGC